MATTGEIPAVREAGAVALREAATAVVGAARPGKLGANRYVVPARHIHRLRTVLAGFDLLDLAEIEREGA